MIDELNILLVEDDLATQANVADILAIDGYQIRVADRFSSIRDGGVDLETDLVILDRRLPDGFAELLLPELKLLLPNADFMMVTGDADLDSTITALRFGVTDYILKPINPDEIRQRLARFARQKRTDRELKREQQFANQVLATAEAIILVINRDGRIVRFNPYFTHVTGWIANDLQGHDWFKKCIPESDRSRVRELFTNDLSAGVLSPLLTTEGRLRQVRWSMSRLVGGHDEVAQILVVGTDVTDLIDAQSVAARSQRLAAIGQTVAGLAHESRNALHRIQASAEILQLDIPHGSESREEVDSILRASHELNHALEEVRNYAAPMRLHREPTSLSDIWRRVWNDLTSQRQGRKAQIIESKDSCECLVSIDVMRLEQVFRNLFENSLAACTDPVCIHLKCLCDGPDFVLLDIQDNGPGVCIKLREKLFEPFYTTRSRGTGLGLSIIQRIIDVHGGDIQIVDPKEPTSNPRGARFLIRLPKDTSKIKHHKCLRRITSHV